MGYAERLVQHATIQAFGIMYYCSSSPRPEFAGGGSEILQYDLSCDLVL